MSVYLYYYLKGVKDSMNSSLYYSLLSPSSLLSPLSHLSPLSQLYSMCYIYSLSTPIMIFENVT